MKAGLAALLEIVRLLASEPDGFPGRLLVTVYGLHEAPGGHAEGLMNLIRRDVKGDAALVMEGPPDTAVVCGKGQSIWNLSLTRPGDTSHELRRRPEDDRLLHAAVTAVQALRAENDRLSSAAHTFPLLGPESIFIGQLHYGDFYNRSPRTCTLQGTRRWNPDKRFEEVRGRLDRTLAQAGLPEGIRAEVAWTFVGESYSVAPEERIVRSLQAASRLVRGAELPLGGVSLILDTSRLVPFGGVPTVPIDCDGATGHADTELVRLPKVVEGCALALATTCAFLDGGSLEVTA